jgi:Acetyl-CoA carboxylase beta subunit
MSAEERIELFFGKRNYTEINPDKISNDPLKFPDKKKI